MLDNGEQRSRGTLFACESLWLGVYLRQNTNRPTTQSEHTQQFQRLQPWTNVGLSLLATYFVMLAGPYYEQH